MEIKKHFGGYMEVVLHWLSTQFKIWYLFFNKRAWQLLARYWAIIQIYETAILLLYAAAIIRILLLSHGTIPEPGTFENINALLIIVMIVPVIVICIAALAVLFILSLLPWSRKVADKIFKYSEFTELEKFKSDIERRLTTLEKFKSETEETDITENIGDINRETSEYMKKLKKRKEE